jgi:hypothetical protein
VHRMQLARRELGKYGATADTTPTSADVGVAR